MQHKKHIAGYGGIIGTLIIILNFIQGCFN